MRRSLILVTYLVIAGCVAPVGPEGDAAAAASDAASLQPEPSGEPTACGPAMISVGNGSGSSSGQRAGHVWRVTVEDGVTDCYWLERVAGRDPFAPRRGELTQVVLHGFTPISAGFSVTGLNLALRNVGPVDARVDIAVVGQGQRQDETMSVFGERIPAGGTRELTLETWDVPEPTGRMRARIGFDTALPIEVAFEPELDVHLRAYPNVSWTPEGRLKTVPLRITNAGNFPVNVEEVDLQLDGEAGPGVVEVPPLAPGEQRWVFADTSWGSVPTNFTPVVTASITDYDHKPIATADVALPGAKLTFLDVLPTFGPDCSDFCTLDALSLVVRNDAATPIGVEVTRVSVDEPVEYFGQPSYDLDRSLVGVATKGISEVRGELFMITVPSEPFLLTLHLATMSGESLGTVERMMYPPTSAEPPAEEDV